MKTHTESTKEGKYMMFQTVKQRQIRAAVTLVDSESWCEDWWLGDEATPTMGPYKLGEQKIKFPLRTPWFTMHITYVKEALGVFPFLLDNRRVT